MNSDDINRFSVITSKGDEVFVDAKSASVDAAGYLAFFRTGRVPGSASTVYEAVAGFARGEWDYWIQLESEQDTVQ